MTLVPEHIFVAAQAGDAVALAKLITQMRPDVRRYARYQCQRSAAVEDVVQEALILLYRRVGTVESMTTLGGWLLKVVTRLCMLPAMMFMHGVEALNTIEDSAYFSHTPPDDLRIDLVRALESLAPSHREIVLMRDFHEMTLQEMATQLGITIEATKSRLHRARAMVKEYLLSGK